MLKSLRLPRHLQSKPLVVKKGQLLLAILMMKTMSLSPGMVYHPLVVVILTMFMPSPTRDSPKKARAKEPSTPSGSKITKSSARQAVFDTTV